MFRSTTLSSSHYAGKWAIPDESQRNDLAVTNQLGYDYGFAADGPEKEAHLHKLLECFHGYLSKYLVMIVRGTIPEPNSRAGKDAKEFLRMLRPADAAKGSDLSNATCKMLHLAFKQQTTEEIYDTLAYCFMRAARRYDSGTRTKYAMSARRSMARRSLRPSSWKLEWAMIALGFCVLLCARAFYPVLWGRSGSSLLTGRQRGLLRRAFSSPVPWGSSMFSRCGSGTT